MLLEGQATGIALATLVTFGHAPIVQSYVVRQYILMLFFASLAFPFHAALASLRETAGLHRVLAGRVAGLLFAFFRDFHIRLFRPVRAEPFNA